MKFWRLLTSIEFCLVLLFLLCVAMAAGSFTLSGEYAAAINAMPLFVWLREAPAAVSWWLWLTLVLLALLALNTVLCGSETLWLRRGRGGLCVSSGSATDPCRVSADRAGAPFERRRIIASAAGGA